jgi:hypothetical protein
MSSDQSAPSDESTRAAHLKWTTNHLPPFPSSEHKPWVWSEDETYALRAACANRFDESLRTESLFCIAATAIRIYLGRQAENQPTESVVDLQAGAFAIEDLFDNADDPTNGVSELTMARACAEAWGLKYHD